MSLNNIVHPVSIVMPVCNEVTVIDRVISEWTTMLNRLPDGSLLEIEDANSNDGTIEILQKWEAADPRIEVTYFPQRDGFTNALRRLLANAKNDWIFVSDSDGQYFAESIIDFDKKFDSSISFLKGVKVNRKDGFFRRLFSFLLNRFLNLFFGFPFVDFNSSHYLIKKDLVTNYASEGWIFTYGINIEITIRTLLENAKYDIVYVRHDSRSDGFSRGNPPLKFLKFGLTSLREAFKLKQHF